VSCVVSKMSTSESTMRCREQRSGQDVDKRKETRDSGSGMAGKTSPSETNKRCSERRGQQAVDQGKKQKYSERHSGQDIKEEKNQAI
jgi:hypothetical protein